MKKYSKAMLIVVLYPLIWVLSACGVANTPYVPVFDLDHLGDLSAGVHHIEIGWTGLDFNHEGQVTLGFWGLGPPGYINYVRDVGRASSDVAEQALMTRHTAAVMAAAQVFNEHFPNVTINALSAEFAGSSTSSNARQHFYQQHGYHMDTWMTSSIVSEILAGSIIDLSIFSDDPVLDLLNPTIMRMFTHADRLWALPTLTIPWGIFVNYSLAESQDIYVPPINWTMEEFVAFVSHSSRDEFYGTPGVPWPIMDTMTQDFHYQLLFRQLGEPFVRMDTPAMRAVNAMAPQIMPHSVSTNRVLGNISASFLERYGNNAWQMFTQGALLTFYANPWFMSFAGVEGDPGRVQVSEWDYFPRPSTQWVGNHVGTAIDVMPIRNIAMDDGNPQLNTQEYDQLRLVWEFLRFYTVDLRSWQARSDMLWGPHNQSAKTESLPYTIGQLYYDMLDIHFQAPERRMFADVRQFPAYHFIMQLWEEGAIWGLWHTASPLFTPAGRPIAHEWNMRWSQEFIGVAETSPIWHDRLLDRLPTWDVMMNERWEELDYDILEATLRFQPMRQRLS